MTAQRHSDPAALAGRGSADPAVLPQHFDETGWSDSSARAVLQLMVESVAEMIGFEVAALSVVLDDDLVTMAYTGPEEYRDYVFEHVDPVSVIEPVIEQAETWGRFRFLAAEDYDNDALEGHWVVFDAEQADVPDAWRPLDVLMAMLTDDAGRLVGVLSLDKPLTGRRPDVALRSLLERYAAQTESAVRTAFEREELVQQVAYAEAARRLIRAASMPAHASLEAVLSSTHRPLVEGFGAAGSWVQVLEPRGVSRGYARTRDGDVVTLSDRVQDIARDVAPLLWEQQRVLVITDDDDDGASDGGATGAVLDEGRHQLKEFELASALAVPLGVGHECLGFLVLTRRAGDPQWSSVERASALQIGHDLGVALMTARARESERALVREMQQLDDYRSQLITTLSHELRTPLTVISGNLELLGELELDDGAARHQQAMARGTSRMKKVVDDLLLLARVSDPRHPLVRVPVDLRAVVGEVVLLVDSTARSKGLALRVDLDPGDLTVPGDPGELDRMLGNLTSNAVKYTPAGGSVTVSVSRREHDVVLLVSDDGLGISEEDQIGLFRAFFRTSNPAALREPGTGLGLTIVSSIVERHAGTVAVESRIGEGTTFTVTLPLAPRLVGS